MEVAFLIALSILGIFLWKTLANPSGLEKLTIISLPTAILAAITAISCLVLYFVNAPKLYTYLSYSVFLLSGATYATLIFDTGKTSSSFITLWTVLSIFSGVFGLLATIPVLIVTSVFIAIEYINGNFSGSVIMVTIFCGILPLVATNFLWIGKPTADNAKNLKNTPDNHNELSEVASKSEVVINAIGDGVMAIDSKGLILLINPAGQNLLGWQEHDALSLSYKSVLKLLDSTDEPLADAVDPIQQVLNTNQEVRNNKFTLLTNSGKKVMVSLVVSPVGDMGSGVIVVFRDITSEKAEEREQAEFISTASHEMRTPIASIEGFLGLALNPATAQLDDRGRDFITKAHEAAQHLGRLFQDLLDISKSEDGRIQNNPKVTNIVPLIHDLVQGQRQKAVEKGLSLTYKPMPDNTNVRYVAPSYMVNLDNDHIREIMNNLIENAVKYTINGEVIVDVTGDEEHVVVSVKDTGIGIPAEDMPHLFQKFYRVDDKETRSIGGTGLGLFLCRKLAEMIGGRIWAESEYKKGSTFYLELPRISSQDAERLKDQEAMTAKIEATKGQPAPTGPTQPVPVPAPAATAPTQRVIGPVVNKVPRGEALTPEQKAAYVAKQRELIRQQSGGQPQPVAAPARPQTVSVPQRVVR